jgi:hypothetical protein
MTQTTRRARSFGSLVISASSAPVDGLGSIRIDLRIPAASRTHGGPIELRVAGAGLELTGLDIEWLVTTNRGWTHFLGTGRWPDGTVVPLRCDLYSAAGDRPDGSDLAVIRVYGPTADPTLDGPVAKFRLQLPPSSIRIGA